MSEMISTNQTHPLQVANNSNINLQLSSNEFGFDFSIRHDSESQNPRRHQTSTNNKEGFDFSINQNGMTNDDEPIKLPPSKPPQIFNSYRNSNSSADAEFDSSMLSSMSYSMSSSMYSSSGSSSSNSRNMSGMNFNFSSNIDEKRQNLKNQRVYIPPFKIKPGNNEHTFTSQSGSSFPGMRVNIIDNEDNLEFPPGFSGAIYS